ncbi:hypothetical protein BC629DRAFT_1594192 [Irpex lacteus]|nr:hypothetical protein BC629DRAFT_1594192 [Irpex lacteus]
MNSKAKTLKSMPSFEYCWSLTKIAHFASSFAAAPIDRARNLAHDVLFVLSTTTASTRLASPAEITKEELTAIAAAAAITCLSTMYPCYGDYWIVGAPPELDYDYTDDDYDVYLFWPSSSQVLVPADTWYPEDFEPVSPLELRSGGSDGLDGLDELDALELGPSQLLNFEPTYAFDADFVFPDNNSTEDNAYGYSRLFRMGLASKVHSHHTCPHFRSTLTQTVDWSALYSCS